MRGVAVGLLACVASSGCAPFGIIYTHTFEPLSTDFHETPVATEHAPGDVKQLHVYVRVLWSGNALGEIAKENGIDQIYYADLETLSVLGIWTQEWAHVYGRRKADPVPAEAP